MFVALSVMNEPTKTLETMTKSGVGPNLGVIVCLLNDCQDLELCRGSESMMKIYDEKTCVTDDGSGQEFYLQWRKNQDAADQPLQGDVDSP